MRSQGEASGETNPADNWISDFSLWGCEKINLCGLSLPACALVPVVAH